MADNLMDVLSTSGKEVYEILRERLSEAGGTASDAAEMDAYLFALHAESYAQKIAELRQEPYTAMDYMQDSFRLNLNTAREDAEYLAAIEAGDMDAVRRMVEAKAVANGFADAIPEQTVAYKMRAKPAPKKTIKIYKVFHV